MQRKFVVEVTILLLFSAPLLFAQAPAGEHNCPANSAIPAYVGPGNGVFSPNQNLCLPQLAPVGGSMGPLSFIVGGSEPGVRVDSQGSVYGVSIRGVPGGIDLWRWFATADGAPNSNGTLPFKYEGQPDNCGILTNGCANNVGSLTNLGLAPGGGDADIAVNTPDPNSGIPNLAATSLTLTPGVTATNSTNHGDSFFNPPNVAAALIPGDDRQWQEATGPATVYLSYHDAATFNIDVQRSNDGGLTYVSGVGEAIDAQTITATGSANTAGQIQFAASDHIIHSGTVSTGGTFGSANRNLLDFFQVALDPQHRANIAFADDHLASPLCSSQTPGHCANNDPAFRVGVPYFTYQVRPNPNIVTGGKCAGS